MSLPVCLVFLGLAIWKEGEGASLRFAIFVTAALFALSFAATRRLLFSAMLCGLFTGAVFAISALKRNSEEMVLHAWDFVYYLTSRAGLSALLASGGVKLGVGVGLVVAAFLLLRFLWRRDHVSRVWPVGLLGAAGFAVLAWQAAVERPERRHTQYFWDALYLGDFYASFYESVEALARGGIVQASSHPQGAPFEARTACAMSGDATARPPHILLIHEESMVQPTLFPGLAFDPTILPFYQSFDGSLRKLRTETYGGASWITEFSLMTGVSSRGYGSMRNYIQSFTSGRLKQTVPQILADCGYRNVFFTPWPKFILAASRFYESIGFAKIFDRTAQGNAIDNERDRFFFNNMLSEIDRHVSATPKPLFAFLETMSAHWPYDIPYAPEMNVLGGGEGTDPEMSEFLRRVAIAKIDQDWLYGELRRRFPNERFLIVRYGDHQPVATRTLLGYPAQAEAEDIVLPDDSPGFLTFYAIDGIGLTPPPLPDIDVIDVPYLGVLILKAAGLSLPPSWAERQKLMQDCDGRYWSCKDHERILDFQARLIEAGEINRH
jgi:phosphoglycerol transferase MdoB-like AlkP superfamily enzyme